MKKVLLLLSLSLVLLSFAFCLSSCGVLRKQAGHYEDFEYVVDDNYEITITGYSGENTKLDIPSWIDGYKVVAIDFDENDTRAGNVESIKIPKTVVSIGEDTFLPLVNLKEITVALDNPEYKYYHGALYSKDGTDLISYPQAREEETLELLPKVDTVASYAFRNARYLKSVTLTRVETLGEAAFVGCSALETVNLGEKLSKISDKAFENCVLLTSVNIPDTVEHVGSYAFGGCTSLSSVSLGNGVSYVGEGAFENLDSLEGIVEFGGAKYLGNATNPYVLLVKALDPEQKSYHVHSSANVIYDSAFEGFEALETVEMPHNLFRIGKRAFYGCRNLKEIDLPDGIASIEEYTFYGCLLLKEISVPSSVTRIGASAFEGCITLSSLTLSDRLTAIEASAFSECISISSLDIPESVTYIGELAFAKCLSLSSVSFAVTEGWTISGSALSATDLQESFAAAFTLKNLKNAMVRSAS